MDSSSSRTALSSDNTTSEIIVREFNQTGYTTVVKLLNSKLECRCSYIPHDEGAMMTSAELNGFLAQCGVKEGINEEERELFAVKAAAGYRLDDILLACGTAPVNGTDGYIDFVAKASQEAALGEHDANIDFRNVQTFINVAAEEIIGRCFPPKAGRSGRSVTGEVIPPPPGIPQNLVIGNNIRIEQQDGCVLIAEIGGRLCQASGELNVEEEYVVEGDVDYRVGSIVFNGVVDIKGDVLDNFSVTATRGLKIGGNVGCCTIKSNGNISLCGMDGQDKGSITCGGVLTAKFLHDCHVECAEDVIVEVEVYHCTINTLGRILVNNGSIYGGVYVALGGIQANKIGSLASARTRLKAGIHYHDAIILEQLYAEMVKNNMKIGESPPIQEIVELRKANNEINEQIKEIRAKDDERANAKINVKTKLYDNTQVYLGVVTIEITEEQDGPISIIENTADGGLRFFPMTGLNVKATDSERAFLRDR